MDLVRMTCFQEQPPTPVSAIPRRSVMAVERYPWTIVLAVSMFLVGLSPLVAAQATPAALWIGTWATSPVQVDSHRSFNRQTLRQIVHTSVPGSRGLHPRHRQMRMVLHVQPRRSSRSLSLVQCANRFQGFRGVPILGG
jgi:hypothetical protein